MLWSELHSLKHVLDGTSLGLISPMKSSSRQTYVKNSVCSTGYFAVKKIAVGESHSYLLKILREVGSSQSFFQFFGQHIALGAVTGEITPPEHHHLSPCMVGNVSVFTIWPESPNIAVSTSYTHAVNGAHPHIVFSCSGQKEGGKHSCILMIRKASVEERGCAFSSLDDFFDIRQGRPSNAYAVDHLTGSHPFDTPPLESVKPPTGSSSSDRSRSARIRAFRALQRAPPEDRERMRREMNVDPSIRSGDGDGKSWTPVHLLSAEEVRSLFVDVVGGLTFLVSSFLLSV